MSISRISSSVSSSAPLPNYAALPAALLAVGTSNTADTPCTLTLTGKRFYFEYRWMASQANIGSQVFTGIGWSGGTFNAVTAETEYTVNTSPYPRSTYSPTFVQAMAGATGSPAMYSAGSTAGGISNGMVLLRGVIDFTAVSSTTLTPYIRGAASDAVYNRSFRVDILA